MATSRKQRLDAALKATADMYYDMARTCRVNGWYEDEIRYRATGDAFLRASFAVSSNASLAGLEHTVSDYRASTGR